MKLESRKAKVEYSERNGAAARVAENETRSWRFNRADARELKRFYLLLAHRPLPKRTVCTVFSTIIASSLRE
jgi:hypothetical protein